MQHFVIVSDFNASNLAALLARAGDGAEFRATSIPYAQAMQSLLGADNSAIPSDANAAIVWTTPQAVSQSFKQRLEFDGPAIETLEQEARQFGSAIARLGETVQHIFVPIWSAAHPLLIRRGLLDMNLEVGLALALMRMNLALHQAVSGDPKIHLFDSNRWVSLCGDKAYDPRLWYAAKTPYSMAVFKHAAADFLAALSGLSGHARKLLLLDLDGTLWGGTVGDDGWHNLRIGGHDPVGEAHRDFQTALRALAKRGTLLGIVSKNDERIALEAIASHPEMLLRAEHFAGWRINWQDKAHNIVDLARELNLGLDSVVFIDDNPVERDRIRNALPLVSVPEWPASPAYFCLALAALDCFDAPVVSVEDRTRTSMYVAERERRQSLGKTPRLDEWLATLDLRMTVERLDQTNLPRAVQLLNKTNQLNLSTRRLSASQFLSWAGQPDHEALVFRVTDKFGDYGLVGIGSLAFDRATGHANVIDFVLSCRVFGRKVEESMFWVLEAAARASGASIMVAEYSPTPKNAPTLAMLERLELERQPDRDRFISSLSRERSFPDCVKLEWNNRTQPERNDATMGSAP